MIPKVKLPFDKLYAIVIFVTCVISFVLIFYASKIKEDKEKAFFSESISTLDIAYRASMEKYKLLAQRVFNQQIKQEKILELFYKGSISKDDEQNIYRGLLYKELYPLYQNLKIHDIRQFHFHLKNGNSFLRFHRPNKSGDSLFSSRKGVEVANTQHIYVDGFETGKIVSGFRNVFPIDYKGQHIGSVEISLSVKAIIDTLSSLDKNRKYSIIVNKNQINSKIFEKQKYLYSTSLVNADYLIEDPNQYLKDSPKPLSNIVKQINQKLHFNKDLHEAMKKGETYGTFVKIYDVDYGVSFLPLIGIDKQIEGYLISYHKVKNLPTIVKFFNLIPIFILIVTIIFIKLLLIIKKKSNNLEYQKQWFTSITETLAEGLYVMNMDGIIQYVNPMACEILGYEKQELLGKCAHTLIHSHSQNNHISQQECPIYKGATENQKFYSSEEFFTRKDGEIISVDISSQSIIKDSQTSQIVTIFKDVSEKKKIEKHMLLLTKAFEASSNSIVITDKDAIVQWANPAFEQLTGYKIQDVVGKNPKEFINSGKQSKEFFENLWTTILDKKPWKNELINKRKDGTFYYEELSITPVLDKDDKIQNFIAIKQDISERKKRDEDVKHFAFYDSLTNLPNRRLLTEHLERIITTLARTQKSVAVLFLDLDKFKDLNDTHGHDAGDELLIQVANRLNNSIRKQDIVSRLGGDEFIVVLDDLPVDFYQAKEYTKKISEKIINAISVSFDLKETKYELTTSIGVYIFNNELAKITTALKNADDALYEAKEKGKNQVCFHKDLNS